MVSLLLFIVAAAQAQDLSLRVGGSPDHLAVSYEARCPDGSLPSEVQLHWKGTVGLEELSFVQPSSGSLSASGTATVLLGSSEISRICQALGNVSSNVTGLIYFSGKCKGRYVPECGSYPESSYLVEFYVDCGAQELTGPTHTSDTGPPKQSLEIQLTETGEGDFGTGGSVSYSFGSCDMNEVKLAVESSTQTETADGNVSPALLSGEAGLALFPARAADFPAGPARLHLDLTFVDLSYVRLLTPPTRRLVPEITAGFGYALVDAQRLGGSLADERDLFAGLDRNSFTLNAGVRLRINLGRKWYRGGPVPSNRYVYLGLQSRWFEARDRDEIQTAAVAGVGFGIRLDQRSQRRAVYRGYLDGRPTRGATTEQSTTETPGAH